MVVEVLSDLGRQHGLAPLTLCVSRLPLWPRRPVFILTLVQSAEADFVPSQPAIQSLG